MPNAAFQDSKWFGGGYIYGTQVVAPGTESAPSILLPSQFATIQEANCDITIGTKELRGIFEDPEDVANSSRKITGKVTTGRVNYEQLNWLDCGQLGGANWVSGSRKLNVNEVQQVPASPGPYTIQVTNYATFFEDKGVTYAGTRLSLLPVSVSPTEAGTYTYNPSTGIYTFSAADALANVLISYISTTTTGHTLTMNNLVMGSNVRPVFEALFQNPNDGDEELLLFACKATKITFPIKQEDYVKLEIDFIAFANNLGQTAQFLSSY